MANPSLAQMLHYDSPDTLISTVTDISRQLYVDPNKREEMLALLNQSGVVRALETELKCRDGEVISVSANVRAVRDLHRGSGPCAWRYWPRYQEHVDAGADWCGLLTGGNTRGPGPFGHDWRGSAGRNKPEDD